MVACATPNGFIPAGFLALGLSYSFQLTTYLKFAVRMMAAMEAGMNAVERQKFYIDNVEREDDTTMLTTTTRWVAVLCLNVKTSTHTLARRILSYHTLP